MAGAVHVGIVALIGRVLHVRCCDGDTPLLLFRSIVDTVESPDCGKPLLTQGHRNGRGKSCFSVVNVTDRSYIDVRLVSCELFFCHGGSPQKLKKGIRIERI